MGAVFDFNRVDKKERAPSETDKNESLLWSVLLYKQPSEIIQHLPIIRDELKNPLSDLSTRLKDLGAAWQNNYKRANLDIERSLAAHDYMWTRNPKSAERIKQLGEEINKIPQNKESDNLFNKMIGIFGGFAPFIKGMALGGAYRGLQGATSGAAAGALAGAPTVVGEPITATSGALLGASAGFTAGSAEWMTKVEAGNSYLRLLDMGFTDKQAKLAGTLVGIANGIVMTSGIKFPKSFSTLASKVPGLSRFIEGAAADAAKSASSRFIKLGSLIKKGVVDVGRGDAIMVTRELNQIMAEEFLKQWNNRYTQYALERAASGKTPISKDDYDSLGKRVYTYGERLWNVAKDSTGAFASLAAVGLAGGELAKKLPKTPEVLRAPELNSMEEARAVGATLDKRHLPDLIDKRKAWADRAVKEFKEGRPDLETIHKISMYDEAIKQVAPSYDPAYLPPSRLADQMTLVDHFKKIIRDQTGAVTVMDRLEGMTPEAATSLRNKLIKNRRSLIRRAGGVEHIYNYLKSQSVPAAIAENVRDFVKNEKANPFKYRIAESIKHALQYKGKADGADWYRHLNLGDFVKGLPEEEAVKFFMLLSTTSRKSTPLVNFKKTVNLWRAYLSGQPEENVLAMRGIVPKEELRDVLYGNASKKWSIDLLGQEQGAIKLRDFVGTLMRAFKDPELLQDYAESVQDFRMGQYFYGRNNPPEGFLRERAKARILAVRDRLREIDDHEYWTSDRVQAALWHWIKAYRIKKGLDPTGRFGTFATAKKINTARYFAIPIEKVTPEHEAAWVATQVTGRDWAIFDHYRKKGASWTATDVEMQGSGRRGREWTTQEKPGEDRPKMIHLYEGRTTPEREFWNDERTRVVMQTGAIYDNTVDPLGLYKKYHPYGTAGVDSKQQGAFERAVIKAGYKGIKSGNVVVMFSPVRVFPMMRAGLSISPTAADEVIMEALKNGERKTAETLLKIKRLNESGDQEAIDTYVKGDLVNTLDHPLIDPLDVRISEGRWMGGHELSLAAVVETGDLSVLLGKVASYLKRYGQEEGYVSIDRGKTVGGKRPQGIPANQAPSYILVFKKKLTTGQLEILAEALDRNGISGLTYIPETNTLIVHHIMSYGLSGRAFKTGIQKAMDEALGKGVERPDIVTRWFYHHVLRRDNYDAFIERGAKREKQLGFDGLRETFAVDPATLPEYIQKRGDISNHWKPVAASEEARAEVKTHTLMDPDLREEIGKQDKVYHIPEGMREMYLREWLDDEGKVRLNSKWDMTGEDIIAPVEEVTPYKPGMFEKLKRIVAGVLEDLKDETGSIVIESRLLKRLRRNEEDLIEITKPEDLTLKERIYASIRRSPLNEFMVTEPEALKAAFKKAAYHARRAYAEGKKEGIDLMKVRIQETRDKNNQRILKITNTDIAKVQYLKGKHAERVLRLKAQMDNYKATVRAMRDAARVRKTVTAMINKMKAVKKNLNTLPDPWKSQLEQIFEKWDTTKLLSKKRLQLESLRTMLENDPNVDLPERVFEDLARLDKKPMRDLSVEDLTSLYQAVMHANALGRMEKEITVRGQTMLMDQYAREIREEMRPEDQLIGTMRDGAPGKIAPFKSMKDIIKKIGLGWINYDTMIELMAGNNSRLYDVLSRAIKEGRRIQQRYAQQAMKRFWEYLDSQGVLQRYGIRNLSKWAGKTIKIEGGLQLTRDERMALYRHSLNPDNIKAILEGGIGFKNKRGWSPDENLAEQYTPEAWKQKVMKTLASITEAEKAIAGDAVTQLFQEQGQKLAGVYRMILGYEFPHEPNYYPKDTMPGAYSLHDFESKNALEEFHNRNTRIGVDKGMLHRRMRVQYPIYLNGLMEDVARSVAKSAAYIGLEMPIRNAFRVLARVKGDIVRRYGRDYYKAIETGLRDIVGEATPVDWFGKAMRTLRKNLTVATLGLNIFTAVKQSLSFPLFLRFVDAKHLTRGLYNWEFHRDAVKTKHDAWSPEWVQRVEGGFNRDIADIIDKKLNTRQFFKGTKGIISKAKELTMRPIRFMDKETVGPGMEGAFLQAMDQFNSGKVSNTIKGALGITDSQVANLSVADKYRLAYQYADWVVSKTQPMFNPEFRSGWSRGDELVKLFTMYSSFTNNALNLMVRDIANMKRKPSKEHMAAVTKTILLLAVLNPAGIVAINTIRDQLKGREDKKSFLVKMFDSLSGYFYVLRDLVPYFTSRASGDRGFAPSLPAQQVTENVTRVLGDIGDYVYNSRQNPAKAQKALDRMPKDLTYLLSIVTGVPLEGTLRQLQLAGLGEEKHGWK